MELATRHQAAAAAWAAIDRRRYAVASELISRMLSDSPHDPEAHRAWGHVLMGRGRRDDAVEAFSHAVTLDLLNPRAHFELGAALIDLAEHDSAYFRDSHWARATEAVDHGLALDPENEAGRALLDLIRKRRAGDYVRTADRTPRRMVAAAVGPYAGVDRHTSIPLALRLLFFVMSILPAAIYAGLSSSRQETDAITGSTALTTVMLLVATTLVVRVFIVYPLRDRQDTIVLPR